MLHSEKECVCVCVCVCVGGAVCLQSEREVRLVSSVCVLERGAAAGHAELIQQTLECVSDRRSV